MRMTLLILKFLMMVSEYTQMCNSSGKLESLLTKKCGFLLRGKLKDQLTEVLS